jgi:hypothetical protein
MGWSFGWERVERRGEGPVKVALLRLGMAMGMGGL